MTGKEETSPRGRGGLETKPSKEESPNGWEHKELKTALTKWGVGKTGFLL
jgi:hypothetical protein